VKTVRVQAEELLLADTQTSLVRESATAKGDTQEIGDLIRLLLRGSSEKGRREQFVNIGECALSAYQAHGLTLETIRANPNTPFLVALVLLCFDRYRDGLLTQPGKRGLDYWKTAAHALFLVQESPGRPGLFSVREKSQLKRTYSRALSAALEDDKTLKQAHNVALHAAVECTSHFHGPEDPQYRVLRAKVKRIVQLAGLRPVGKYDSRSRRKGSVLVKREISVIGA
jgi:hypothetical protein